MPSVSEPKHPNSPYLTEEWRKHAWNKETVSWLLSRHDWDQVEKFLEFWDGQFMDGALYKGAEAALAVPTPSFVLHLLHAWAYGGRMKDDAWAEELLAGDAWEELLLFVDGAARDGGEGRPAKGRVMVRLFKHLLYSSAPLTEERFAAAAPSVYKMNQIAIEDLSRFYKNPTMPQSVLVRAVDAFIKEVSEAHAKSEPWNLRDSKNKVALLLAHAASMDQSTFSRFGKFLLKEVAVSNGHHDVGVRQLIMQVVGFPSSKSSGFRHELNQLQRSNPGLLAVTGWRFDHHTRDLSQEPCISATRCRWKEPGQTDDVVGRWWDSIQKDMVEGWSLGLNDRTIGPFFCEGTPAVAKHRAAFVEAWMARRTGGAGENQPLERTELFMVCFMGAKVEGVYDALGGAADHIPAAWLEELLG